MQDTEKNQAKYPKWRNQKIDCGFPIARWAVLFCLATGMVLEMYLEPMKVSERVMFRRFYKSFSPGFRSKKNVIATTLNDHTIYTKQDLADLYLRRWEAEIDLRHLKTTLKMEMFKSHTLAMFEKEVWSHLLVYNLIRRIMWKAATTHNVPPLRISFKGTLDRINAFSPYLSS